MNQGLYTHDKDKAGLTKRQRQVRDLLAGGRNQLEVASELGLTRQRVRQIVEDLARKGVLFPGYKLPEDLRGTKQ